MKAKYLIIIIIALIINSCNTQKKTVIDKHQEDYKDKRQEDFNELYDEHH